MNNLVILTGVSGAGKTSATLIFEELGYYLTENIPSSLFDDLFNEFSKNEPNYKNVYLTVSLDDALEAFNKAKSHKNLNVMFVGLDATIDVLMERYRLSRHIHPLQLKGLSLDESLHQDHEKLRTLRQYFTHYFDTSKSTYNEMRLYFHDAIKGKTSKKLNVIFSSFGYKRSIPLDLDMIVDVRILPNPYWEESLREYTGLDEQIKHYVLYNEVSQKYLREITSMLDTYLQKCDESARSIINVGIGCSGGQHRSVVVAEYLKEHYKNKYIVHSEHRDIPNKK